MTIEGKVAWRDDHGAGICFFGKLHDLVVSVLGFHDAKSDLHGRIGRDRFGRPLPNPGSATRNLKPL